MIGLFVALIAAAIAQQPASAPASRPAASPSLFELLPDDTVAALSVENPARALPRDLALPMLARLLPGAKDPQRIWKVLGRMPGPLVVCGTSEILHDKDATLIFIAEARRSAADLDRFIESEVVPLFNTLTGVAGNTRKAITLDTSRLVRLVKCGDDVVFAYVVHAGRVLGSTDRKVVQDWLDDKFPQRAWAADPHVRKWMRALPASPRLRLFYNPIPVLKTLPRPRDNSAEDLALRLLSPSDIIAASGELNWDRDSITLELTAIFAEKTQGLGRALVAASSSSRAFGMLPDDFHTLGRLSWSSAAGLVEQAYAVLDQVDPDIGAEYRAELKDFQAETGVDFHGDILANLVGEVAFGGRYDLSEANPLAWTVVCPVTEPARFEQALLKLLNHYKIPMQQQSAEGIDIRMSVLGVPFCFTVADHCLMLADSPLTIAALHHRADAAGPVPARRTLARCLERCPQSHTFSLLLDIKAIAAGLGPFANAIGPARSILTGTVGITLAAHDRQANLRAIWIIPTKKAPQKPDAARPDRPDQPDAALADAEDQSAPLAALAQLMGGVANSVARARQTAQRTVSAANMRGVGQGVYIYAQNHKGQFPPDLGALIKEQSITLEMLQNVYDATGPASVDEIAARCGYYYRPGLTDRTDPTEVLLCERTIQQGEGANFLFVDGHVEFIAEPKASELIAKIQSGADSVKR